MSIGVKILIHAGVRIATDEEARKRAVIIVMIPIIVVLLILIMFMYILASPIESITDFFDNNVGVTAVTDFKNTHDNIITLENNTHEFHGKYLMPMNGNIIITSPYGYRIHPITGEDKMHTGIDMVTTHHAQIISIADGQVVKINLGLNGYGNYILIKHETEEETFYSFYAHLSKIYVIPNQKVIQGDVIALEGGQPNVDPNVGSSTGHHLHFEIRKDTSTISHTNPNAYINAIDD